MDMDGRTSKFVQLYGRANWLGKQMEEVKGLTVEKVAEELRTRFGLERGDLVMVETGASDWKRDPREDHGAEHYTAAEYAAQVRPLMEAVRLTGASLLVVTCHSDCLREEKLQVGKILKISILGL